MPVHPRSRGEHPGTNGCHGTGAGSSPLARGTRGAITSPEGNVRFIPARAGNTVKLRSAPRPGAVHPRSRGEHIVRTRGAVTTIGSSPLARGTLAPLQQRRPLLRFIPARAGNTTPATSGAAKRYGSSPLARGTLRGPRGERPRGRFIPARAGNTAATSSAPGACTVHPRSRGEHGFTSECYDGQNGSSPLARGTLFPELFDQPHFFRRQGAYQ